MLLVNVDAGTCVIAYQKPDNCRTALVWTEADLLLLGIDIYCCYSVSVAMVPST